MTAKNELMTYLYKHKLNQASLMSLLDQLKDTTMQNVLDDMKALKCKEKILYVFSDGNVKGNGKKTARGGYSIYFSDPQFARFNKTRVVSPEPTNNKAELSGIKAVIKIVYTNPELFTDTEVVICTDSKYSIDCLTKWCGSWEKNGWKNSKGEPVKNKELIQSILNIQADNIKFKHVFGHTVEPRDKTSTEWFFWNGNKIVDDNINQMLALDDNNKLKM